MPWAFSILGGNVGRVLLAGQDLLDLAGKRVQAGDDPPAVRGREVVDTAQVQGQQGEGDRRGGEGLGRGDRDLRAGVQVHAAVALPGDGAAH
jgi:hypothetical protein